MKVTKSTVTTYEIDLGSTPKTPITIAKAIGYIAEAGVNLDRAEFEDDNYKKFRLVVRNVAYYDDSTLDRLGVESPRYEVGIKIDNVTTRADMAEEVSARLKKRESLDPRY